MRPEKNRQHRLPFCALFFAVAQTLFAETPPADGFTQELQAARVQTVSLTVRGASAEEWGKLERTFADLAMRYPREPSVRSARAEFLWEREDRERAIREWEAAEQLAPRDPLVLARLADAHLALGRGKASAQYFQKASDASPNDPRLRHAAGNATFLFRHELVDAQSSEAKILATALEHLAAASRLAPQDAEYARAYAETFYGVPNPDWSAALRAWEHFRSVSPNQDFAYANLARIHIKLGQTGAASSALDRIQSTDFERLKSKLRAQVRASASKAPAP